MSQTNLPPPLLPWLLFLGLITCIKIHCTVPNIYLVLCYVCLQKPRGKAKPKPNNSRPVIWLQVPTVCRKWSSEEFRLIYAAPENRRIPETSWLSELLQHLLRHSGRSFACCCLGGLGRPGVGRPDRAEVGLYRSPGKSLLVLVFWVWGPVFLGMCRRNAEREATFSD